MAMQSKEHARDTALCNFSDIEKEDWEKLELQFA